MLIMGLFAGLVVTSARPDEGVRLRAEAERLAGLLELAAAEASLTGRRLAWSADGTHYRFWRWREDAGWTEARDDSLRPRLLPQGIALSGLRVEAAGVEALRLEFSPHVPQSYELQISLGEARYAIAASPLGEVSIHAPR